SLTGANIAGIIWGRPESLVSNVTLKSVRFSAPTKTLDIYHATGVKIVDSQLTAPNTTTNALTLYHTQITITNSAPSTNVVRLGGLTRPSTNNALAFFNALATISDTNVIGASPITLGASTVTVSNTLTLVPASVLSYALGTNAALIAATGNLNLNGTLNVADAGGLTNTSYTIFTYTGALSGSGLTLGTAPSNFGYILDTNTAGQVKLSLLTAFEQWQVNYFGSTNSPSAAATADPDGDGQNNTS